MANIFFLFGTDTYSIKAKAKTIEEKFKSIDPSGMNIARLDGAKINYGDYAQAVLSVPFLAEKKLIVIDNFLLENANSELKKKIGDQLEKIPQSSTVLFCEYGQPDKRSSLFKKLKKPKIAAEFSGVMSNKIRQIIQNKLVEENIKIDNYALSKLEMAVGTDLWLLKNSMEKLVLSIQAENRSEIFPEDIDNTVSFQNETKIFDLSDALIRRNLGRALELLRALLKGGDNELQIFTFIVSQYRTLLIISDLIKQGKTSGEIVSLTKMHPFVIKKNIELARHCPLARASAVYRLLQEYDVKLKTGYGEPEVLLTMLMNKITSSH